MKTSPLRKLVHPLGLASLVSVTTLLGTASGSVALTNGGFESPAQTESSVGTTPTGWSTARLTDTGTTSTQLRQGIAHNSQFPTLVHEGNQSFFIDTAGDPFLANGHRANLYQQITGFSAGDELAGSIYLTPMAGMWTGDAFTVTYGFFSNTALTNPLGSTVTISMSGLATNSFLNHGNAIYEAVGGETIYFGVISEVFAPEAATIARSGVAFDSASVAVIPEPASVALFTAVIAALAILRRRPLAQSATK